jgi:hypothetical protein
MWRSLLHPRRRGDQRVAVKVDHEFRGHADQAGSEFVRDIAQIVAEASTERQPQHLRSVEPKAASTGNSVWPVDDNRVRASPSHRGLGTFDIREFQRNRLHGYPSVSADSFAALIWHSYHHRQQLRRLGFNMRFYVSNPRCRVRS